MAENGSSRPASKVVKALVLQALIEGPVAFGELPARVGRDPREVARARAELVREGAARSIGLGRFASLALPETGSKAPSSPAPVSLNRGEKAGDSGRQSRALLPKSQKLNEEEGQQPQQRAPREISPGDSHGRPRGAAWRVVEALASDLRSARARVDQLGDENMDLAAQLDEAREQIAALRAELVHRDLKPANGGRVSPGNEVSPCTVSSPAPQPVAIARAPEPSATASSAAPPPCAAPAAPSTSTSSSTAVAPHAVAREATPAEIREAAEEELLLARRRGKKVDFPEPWLKPKIEEMQQDHERVFDVLARKKDRITQDAREVEAIKKRGEENAKTRAALGIGIDESVLAKIREEAREAEVKRVREALAS